MIDIYLINANRKLARGATLESARTRTGRSTYRICNVFSHTSHETKDNTFKPESFLTTHPCAVLLPILIPLSPTTLPRQLQMMEPEATTLKNMTETVHHDYAFPRKFFSVEDTNHMNNNNDDDMIPQQFDIVCGRSKLSQNHFGNRRFRALINQNRDRYRNAQSRPEKTSITIELVAKLRQFRPGGRFLLWDEASGTWQEAGDAYAREKVSHALRSTKKRAKYQTSVAKKKSEPGEVAVQEKLIIDNLIQEQQRVFQYLIQQEALGR